MKSLAVLALLTYRCADVQLIDEHVCWYVNGHEKVWGSDNGSKSTSQSSEQYLKMVCRSNSNQAIFMSYKRQRWQLSDETDNFATVVLTLNDHKVLSKVIHSVSVCMCHRVSVSICMKVCQNTSSNLICIEMSFTWESHLHFLQGREGLRENEDSHQLGF